MAKYTINHTCGHSREVQLFGKNIERENKINWMESQECPRCWGAKKREEEAQKPITATIKTNGMDVDDNGNVLAEIILTGGTINKKAEIKEMGYRWGEVRGGIMNMLSLNKPQQAWIKFIPILHLAESNQIGKKVKTELESIDAIIETKISPIDFQFAAKKISEKKEKDEKISKIEKPEIPGCLPSNRGKWNKKIYGTEKYGYRVYIDNSEEKISNEEAEEIKTYLIAKEKYNMAIEEIQRGEFNA